MSPELGRLVPKTQGFVVPFFRGEGKTIPYFNLKSLQIRSEILLLKNETEKINNLTGK